MHGIISQRDFRQLEHITPDGSRSKQLSGFLAACCLDHLADLFYQDSSPISVGEPTLSKATLFPIAFRTMRGRRRRLTRTWGIIRNNHSGLLRATESSSDVEPELCADVNKIPSLFLAQKSKLLN
jgi:hypothetical protein